LAEKLFLDKIAEFKREGDELKSLKEALERHKVDSIEAERLAEQMDKRERSIFLGKLKSEEDILSRKVERKEASLLGNKEQRKEGFAGKLSIFKNWRERYDQSETAIGKLSKMLEKVTGEEDNFRKRIEDCEERIQKSGLLKLAGDVQEMMIKNFSGQKTLAEANMAEYVKLREALSSRIDSLRAEQSKLGAVLDELDGIGKTDSELAGESKKEDSNSTPKSKTDDGGDSAESDDQEDKSEDDKETPKEKSAPSDNPEKDDSNEKKEKKEQTKPGGEERKSSSGIKSEDVGDRSGGDAEVEQGKEHPIILKFSGWMTLMPSFAEDAKGKLFDHTKEVFKEKNGYEMQKSSKIKEDIFFQSLMAFYLKDMKVNKTEAEKMVKTTIDLIRKKMKNKSL